MSRTWLRASTTLSYTCKDMYLLDEWFSRDVRDRGNCKRISTTFRVPQTDLHGAKMARSRFNASIMNSSPEAVRVVAG